MKFLIGVSKVENQHRKISGYRDLDQKEIDLMNEIKALGPQIEGILLKIEKHISDERGPKNNLRMNNATPERFLALAKTELQTGLMYATRAIAQPEFF